MLIKSRFRIAADKRGIYWGPAKEASGVTNLARNQHEPVYLRVKPLSSLSPHATPLAIMSIDLSLDRIKVLLARLPAYDRPTIHIAGTNGKGSTSALVSSILHAGELSVGRFNSPHLVSVLDCITIDGSPVNEADYTSAREAVVRADTECDTHVTSFELLTCTALCIFQRAQVDVAVLEVGLGGRLDATNVIPDECVFVSALTAVDLDHQAFLGNTVDEVAREKAAIARKGRPFVLGPQKHGEVLGVVKDVVGQVGADLVEATPTLRREWDGTVDGQCTWAKDRPFQEPPPQSVILEMPCFTGPVQAQLPLHGEHQLDNLGTAAEIINTLLTHSSCTSFSRRNVFTPNAVALGVKSTRWRGRLSFHRVPLDKIHLGEGHDLPLIGNLTVLADGAHNPSSASTLATFISQLTHTPKRTKIHLAFVLAFSHSPPKTPLQTLSSLLSFTAPAETQVTLSVAGLGFTPVEGMPWVNSVPSADLQKIVQTLSPDAAFWSPPERENMHVETLREALGWSARQIDGSEGLGLVILAGSLYLVADFYRLLERSIYV